MYVDASDHAMVVDQVSHALLLSSHDHGSTRDLKMLGTESNNDKCEEDEEQKNEMTLGDLQNGVKKEALVRRIQNVLDSSYKKVR